MVTGLPSGVKGVSSPAYDLQDILIFRGCSTLAVDESRSYSRLRSWSSFQRISITPGFPSTSWPLMSKSMTYEARQVLNKKPEEQLQIHALRLEPYLLLHPTCSCRVIATYTPQRPEAIFRWSSLFHWWAWAPSVGLAPISCQVRRLRCSTQTILRSIRRSKAGHRAMKVLQS